MIKKSFFSAFILFIFVINPVISQTKEITLDDIYKKGMFYPRSIQGIRSMNDGEHYTTLVQGQKIIKYSYLTGEEVETVLNLNDIDPGILTSISDYDFSPDESKILLETNRVSIYRHSYKADFYVYDIKTKNIVSVSKNGQQQLASFSPDGKNVAFVRENNLFYKDLAHDAEIQITSDGEWNNIINGAPDWVYEEEFGFSKAFGWSPEGDKIAFYKFDESRVKQFNMTMYGELYPEWYQFKYPKAGEENAIVEILVFDLATEKIKKMDIGTETDQYIPRIKWTKDNNTLAIMRLNRKQNKIDILFADALNGSSNVVYTEENKRYIAEVDDDYITFVENNSFIISSEKSGYKHFNLYSNDGSLINQITSGDYDCNGFLGYNENDKSLYFSSFERSALQRDVYKIKLTGKGKKLLTEKEGTNRTYFSNNFKYFINIYSNANTPYNITLNDKNGKQLRVIEDNARLKATMDEYGFAKKEFISIPTSHQYELNGFIIKPKNFDPNKEYPLFMYVYGGPESQEVTDAFSTRDAWFQMLAQKGYIVACIDNRGTDGRGEDFRKATYLELGKLETEDQIEAAKYLGSLSYIDKDRIGMFGWSYGGFMTLSCLTKGADVFKMGISVAPVTNWRFYDTIYTERFMRTPQENASGYDDNSPINHVDKLKGKLLLVHGMGDDNVHFQNSVELTEKMVQANKQFEMQFYPNKNHGIYGGNTTYHLYTRMTNFILENL